MTIEHNYRLRERLKKALLSLMPHDNDTADEKLVSLNKVCDIAGRWVKWEDRVLSGK